jgi:hypothetical protein
MNSHGGAPPLACAYTHESSLHQYSNACAVDVCVPVRRSEAAALENASAPDAHLLDPIALRGETRHQL